MPVLDAEKQQMTIRQTFWKKKDGKKQKGIQLWGDKIAFNLIGSPGDPHHFEELEAIATPWLARWAEHFQIKRFCGVSMEYVNLLSQETMPTFMDGPTFKAGSVLVPIQHIPGPYHLLTTPYDFQMNFKIPNDTLNLRFTARCHSVKLEPLEMHLRFTAMTYDEVKNYTIDQIQDQIKVAHQLILTEFESFFTEGAKLTFEPYAPDHS